MALFLRHCLAAGGWLLSATSHPEWSLGGPRVPGSWVWGACESGYKTHLSPRQLPRGDGVNYRPLPRVPSTTQGHRPRLAVRSGAKAWLFVAPSGSGGPRASAEQPACGRGPVPLGMRGTALITGQPEPSWDCQGLRPLEARLFPGRCAPSGQTRGHRPRAVAEGRGGQPSPPLGSSGGLEGSGLRELGAAGAGGQQHPPTCFLA